MNKLPIALEREPLIDAVFQLRLDGSVPHADILPGILYHELDPKPTINRLPASELPQPVRASDPALIYAPTQRLEWENYFIDVGDRSIAVSCKLPYPKWMEFKKAILGIIQKIAKVGVTGKVERCSVKYVNLIEGTTLANQINKIDLELRIGGLQVKEEHVNIQVHHIEDEIVHILSVISSANLKKSNGKVIQGIVVNVDSIRNINLCDFTKFSNELEPELEKLRQSNKVWFFKCLKQETIDQMGPIYE